MELRPHVLFHLFLLSVVSVRSQQTGTCFLSPFQLPSSAPPSPPSNSLAEFRTAFASNQLSPISGNSLSEPGGRSNAHGNAPQVPPAERIVQDNRIDSAGRETSQVKEDKDRKFDGFVFPGARPDRPSTPKPPAQGGTDNRFIFPGEVPAIAPPAQGGTDNRFIFPGEVPSTPTTTTKGGTDTRVFPGIDVPAPRPPVPPAPVIQQKERVIVRRPASRIFGTKGFSSDSVFFTPTHPLINREELEAISQFEAALEEAKREGLYGLRTRSRPRTTPAPPRPPSRPPRVNSYATKSYNNGYQTGSQGRGQGTEFFELGISDFKQSFGFDPVQAGLIREQTRSLGVRQPKQLFSDSSRDVDDDGFGPRLPPPPPLSQILPPTQAPVTLTAGRFYDWLDRSSFLTNMRIAPGTNFTVLLPNDAAISLLPAAFISELEGNATKLREILFYHIIPESIGVETIQSEDMIPTLLRKKDIRVSKASASDLLMMSGAGVLGERRDLELDGGKVRFIQIDRVLIPPRGTLYEVIAAAPGLSIFKGLVDNTGLRQELERDANSGTTGLTIFAPTDAAFAKVNNEAATLLTRDAAVARSFLLNHFARPVVFASSIQTGSSSRIRNLGSDQELRLERPAQDLVRVNDVTVTFADVLATNGVLHVIDHVLL